VNEELDDAAVTAAVAGYPRTGRDLADGYLLAALVIRAMYDQDDPEIGRALRLYSGDTERLGALSDALSDVRVRIHLECDARATREQLADAAATVLLPRVPGEVTQEIRRPCRHLLRAPNGRCMDCGMDAG
jgi:hypothetical protein